MALVPLIASLTPWVVVAIVLLLVGAVLLIVHMVRTSPVPMLVRIRAIGLWVERRPDATLSVPAVEGPPQPVPPRNKDEPDTGPAPPSNSAPGR